MEINVLKDCYQVSYSRLQGKFMLVNMETKHVVKDSDLFMGIYEKIRSLKKKGHIDIVFSDSAIDELQLRGFEREEVLGLGV